MAWASAARFLNRFAPASERGGMAMMLLKGEIG